MKRYTQADIAMMHPDAGREFVDADVAEAEIERLREGDNLIQKALFFIERWGGIDGGHHKQWLLDQLVRVLTKDYEAWVARVESGENGPKTYLWDEGIAP